VNSYQFTGYILQPHIIARLIYSSINAALHIPWCFTPPRHAPQTYTQACDPSMLLRNPRREGRTPISFYSQIPSFLAPRWFDDTIPWLLIASTNKTPLVDLIRSIKWWSWKASVKLHLYKVTAYLCSPRPHSHRPLNISHKRNISSHDIYSLACYPCSPLRRAQGDSMFQQECS